MVDALGRKDVLLTFLHVKIIGFDVVKELYCDDADFGEIWKACVQRPFKDFVIINRFLFKRNLLAILVCFLGLSILDELHGTNLSGHFRRNKTLTFEQANFFSSKLGKDVDRIVAKCIVCMLAKTRSQSSGLLSCPDSKVDTWQLLCVHE